MSLLPSVETVRAVIMPSDSEEANSEMASRLPFALASLPRLKKLLLYSGDDDWHAQTSPDEVWDIFVDLMKSLASGCRAKSFEQLVWIELGC